MECLEEGDRMRRISPELVEKKLQESHSEEIAHDLSRVRFDADDSMDGEYIAEDIAAGIVKGILNNKYIHRSVDKGSIIEMIAMQLDSFR